MPADQLLAQRIVWSALFSALLIIGTGKLKNLYAVFGNPRLLFMLAGSAASISINWLVYLWAVTNGHVLDASLGYFINPLFNVLLGRIFFSERLNKPQMAAVALVLVGILWLAIPAGSSSMGRATADIELWRLRTHQEACSFGRIDRDGHGDSPDAASGSHLPDLSGTSE